MKVTCSQCHRTFFAKVAAGKRPRPKDNSKAYVGFGVLAVLIVGSFIVIKSSGGTPAVRPAPAPVPVAPDTSLRNPTVAAIKRWADAVAANNTFGLKEATDLGAAQALLGVTSERAYANTTGDEREKLEQEIFAAFQNHESTRYLRDLECTDAMMLDAAMATAAQGSVRVYLSPKKDATQYKQNARCEVKVDYRMEGTQPRVTAWTVEIKPIEVRQKGERFVPHEKIERPKTQEIDFMGHKMEVSESQPVALEHLPEASPELRQEIDKLVADLIQSADPSSPGTLFNRATNRIVEIGRPAVARLLNALFELSSDVMANNLKISQIDRCLRQVSGNAYAYPVADQGTAEQLKAARMSSIKQWFAWWYQYHKGDFQKLIETEESLDVKKDPAPAAGKTPAKK